MRAKRKGKRSSGSLSLRGGVVTLRGKAAHDFINNMQAALGGPHCTADKHLQGCGHKKDADGE